LENFSQANRTLSRSSAGLEFFSAGVLVEQKTGTKAGEGSPSLLSHFLHGQKTRRKKPTRRPALRLALRFATLNKSELASTARSNNDLFIPRRPLRAQDDEPRKAGEKRLRSGPSRYEYLRFRPLRRSALRGAGKRSVPSVPSIANWLHPFGGEILFV